ncbi:MAG: hypothetical protein E6Q44_12565 [Flavobacteriales bacterium]|jgi:hypothetical protein|nr:MAG: hypothetical protein E6Q44_12565 [Flavobacteriales bacterium]
MARKKNKPVNASTARVRVAPKKRTTGTKQVRVKSTRSSRTKAGQPPSREFKGRKWFGAFPELAGPTLRIQRQLRNEW